MGMVCDPERSGPAGAGKGDRMAARLRGLALLGLSLFLLAAGCASQKENRAWDPGDRIICPHCGREFPVPEKLGK